MDNPKRISVEVTEDEHREAHEAAKKWHVSVSFAVRELLRLWATGQVNIRTGGVASTGEPKRGKAK